MKITFLGTSHGLPEPDRYCSATLIEAGGRRYLIDAGAPVADLLLRHGVAYESINDIFITHTHGDHVNGLIELIDLMTWYYKDADPTIHIPEEKMRQALEGWLDLLHGGNIPRHLRYELEAPGKFFDDGVLSVTAIPTAHLGGERPAYSFMLESEGKRVILTGDMTPTLADFPVSAFETETELIVCEGAHSRLAEHIDLLSGCKTKLFGVVHVNGKRNTPENMEKFVAGMPMKVHHFSDGEIIEI